MKQLVPGKAHVSTFYMHYASRIGSSCYHPVFWYLWFSKCWNS